MPRMSQEHLDARQRQILAAAHRRLARHGFRETTMQQIADEAGLSVGTLYRYFDDKEALIEALAGWGRSQKRDEIGSLAPPSGVEGLAELVSRLAGRLPPAEASREAVRFDIRLGEALGQPALESLVRESLRDFRDLIADYVRDARSEGRIAPDVDAEPIGRILLSLLIGLELQVAFEPDLDREAYVAAIGRLLRGLENGTG